MIHLLNKRRFREMEWAAMKWLLEAVRKNSRRIQLEQWLLLAIRTLVILLVVMAMAKPLTNAVGSLFVAQTSASHNIVVFDNSESMHYSLTDRSRWERAKGMAQSILDDAQQGDLMSVVVMGASPTILVGDPSPYLAAVSEEIDAIKPQHGLGQVEPAMDKVADILKISRAGRKNIFLITDLQRGTWTGPESTEGDAGELGRKLRSIGEQAGFTILDVGSAESPNVAVVGIEQVDPLVVRNRQTMLRARIANFSNLAREDVAVELLVDGQVEATERVSLPPNEQRNVPFVFTFADSGERVVEIRLADDALRIDNHRWQVVNVRDSLAVLLVEGEPSGEPFQSESDYLRVALSPVGDTTREGSEAPSLIRTETRMESDLLEAKLDEWDMVVFCNVGQLTEGEAAVVRDYLKRGGGVLFFLGSQTNIDAYNQMLFKEGKGFFPVKLMGLIGQPGGKEFFSFDPLDYRDPIIQSFQQHEQAGLLTTKIFRYIQAKKPEGSTAKVALAFQKGDPAIVVSQQDNGMVAVVTTSADLDWNTWAISPSFLPMMQELTRQLVSGRVRGASALVGELLSFPAPGQGHEIPVTITPPGEDAAGVSARLEDRDGVPYVNYAATDLSGLYKARFGSPIDQTRSAAVNTWPQESDMTRIEADDLRSMFPGWEFSVLDRWQGASARSASGIQSQGELHRPLLYLALILVFLETFLAWKFGHHQ